MQLEQENITDQDALSLSISVPASAHLQSFFHSPDDNQYATPVGIPSYAMQGQGWDGSDGYLPTSYAPYLDPTTPAYDPANGSNGVYLGSPGHNSFASQYSWQPNPPTSCVQPPKLGYEMETRPGESSVAPDYNNSETAIPGTSSGWASGFSVVEDTAGQAWDPRGLDPPSPQASTSVSSFGTTHGSSHELTRNEVVDPELTGFFQPASSVIELGEKVENYRQQWICTQCRRSVRKADLVSHYLAHLNLKEWKCTCGSTFSSRCNGLRHVREFTPCSACHKKIGCHGKGSFCKHCLA